ncbi:YihY/virulence factor BrkB family protein [Sphaerisporangium sp. TRM90804]|uniref:YihY/virulence factor BrkB family protein n=1 Tax=Sphaerisporangium sp. TRM90804 TaxID=3031113 RepID=UPI00244C161D|nr:YihY/virulence factor BrkB family protein [Sphaerisporangium sp. TRM90804]MDH2428050.1 YihY/virulence factor BrkB family protein [Sphaerisporangium sp. TRM90804]
MSSASRVPETRTMSGEELSADEAWATLRNYGGWHLVRDSFIRFRYADGFSHSRALAFQICLALIPGVIAAVGLSTELKQQRLGEAVQLAIRHFSPGSGEKVIKDALAVSERHAGDGGAIALWAGLITALVGLTTAMAQIERGANRIYGVERDSPVLRKYGKAVVMAVTAGSFMTLGFAIMVGGNTVGEAFAEVYGWGTTAERAWALLRWPAGFLLAVLSASVLFRAAPRRKQPGHTWLAVGAVVSLALWTTFSWGLSFYIENTDSFGVTYGPLTAVVALLLWSLFSSVALFLGLAFSAQLEAVRAGHSTPNKPDTGAREGSGEGSGDHAGPVPESVRSAP